MLLEDKRTGCLSITHVTNIGEYLQLVENVYKDQGGIQGQRSPLKTKTGIRIRNRMIDDIGKGAILPPIVLGATLDDTQFVQAQQLNDRTLMTFLSSIGSDSISIIDGIQRTTALIDAKKKTDISQQPLRIEVWLSRSVNSLIYRMLVLNTGQVPWDIKRQLETVYKPILKEVKEKVPNIDVFQLDDNERRKASSQYQSSKIIEYFLAFSSRKTNIDIKEKVAEDFARMEASESTSDTHFLERYIEVLSLLSKLDNAFSKYKSNSLEETGKFKSGKDIFTSAPAGIGFVAAAAVHIYGHPGFVTSPDDAQANLDNMLIRVNLVIESLEAKSAEEVEEFLDLLGLNERLNRRSGKVGEFEREFFFKAFSVLLTQGNQLQSMEPCWAAY